MEFHDFSKTFSVFFLIKLNRLTLLVFRFVENKLYFRRGSYLYIVVLCKLMLATLQCFKLRSGGFSQNDKLDIITDISLSGSKS